VRNAGVNIDNLRISDRAHILMPYHKDLDSLKEQDNRTAQHIGTTKRGIGPAYADRANRINIRFGT
jgi:adenylosuccinate synthase